MRLICATSLARPFSATTLERIKRIDLSSGPSTGGVRVDRVEKNGCYVPVLEASVSQTVRRDGFLRPSWPGRAFPSAHEELSLDW
ncbi:hypothetical protein APTSU1_001814300 [Apodemus speciosus]|uniref:Uncharacterized protein n=1 Tax=Apodemus speciosus TaxID=105296 RepID=A0ABQ0FUH4_APOSI